jgi:signal transduction histidine kinase
MSSAKAHILQPVKLVQDDPDGFRRVLHDLRNAFQVIGTCVDFFYTDGDQAHEDDFTMFRQARDRFNLLSEKLLSRRKQEGACHCHVKIDSVVIEAIHLCRDRLRPDIRIMVEQSLPAVSPCWDEPLFLRAIANLIRNSIEAIGDGPGTIQVSYEVNEAASSDYVARSSLVMIKGNKLRVLTLRVQDSGPGFPEECVQLAGVQGFSTKERGSGFGLLVVQEFLASCHGDLRIISEPGGGTCVELLLPLP